MDGHAPTNTGAQAVHRGPKTAGAHSWRIMRRNWLTTQKGLPMIKVAILFGGISTEHDVSCKSADNVIRALAGRFELTLIGITKEGEWLHYTGDPADVTNYYWGKEISAVLTQIVNDPQNPGKGKYLVFTVTGDVSSGESLTLSVGQKSANYDAIVPTSAVRSDTNGSFVLVITAKNTPLGNRYTATRADVTVLAQDDTKTAVSGLAYGDFVITTSSKPLEAGMQVKMVENG